VIDKGEVASRYNPHARTGLALMRAHGVQMAGKDNKKSENYLLFPNGPFTGAMGDTVVNFTTETRIEDAQK